MKHLIGLVLTCVALSTLAQGPTRVAFWNVENYYDVINDSLTADDPFTPMGENHWTKKRFEAKRNAIMKVIVAMAGEEWDLPIVVGLAEVENDYVLQQLCKSTPLRKLGYEWVHFDSPDRRGIDCALLYNSSRIQIFDSRAVSMSEPEASFRTRDVLLVGGRLVGGDTLWTMVCHLPSKRGGGEAEHHRIGILHKVRAMADSLMEHYPGAKVVVMGDFNADRHESSFTASFGLDESGRTESGLHDLLWDIPIDQGSYKYQGVWTVIDHLLTNIPTAKGYIWQKDFLLVPDKTFRGLRPNRTYLGVRYQGGYSDHLPVVMEW